MPTGIYKRTKKTKKILSEAHKGIKLSKERRKKMSKNNARFWKGKHLSQETKQKLSIAAKGRKVSKETRRKIGKASKGEKCYFWQGGLSFESYTMDWTKTLRRSIRERDHYTCQICGKLQGDRAFDVHHIDYNKKNCNPNNLVTLCIKCHSRIKTDKKYWLDYFLNFIKRKVIK